MSDDLDSKPSDKCPGQIDLRERTGRLLDIFEKISRADRMRGQSGAFFTLRGERGIPVATQEALQIMQGQISEAEPGDERQIYLERMRALIIIIEYVVQQIASAKGELAIRFRAEDMQFLRGIESQNCIQTILHRDMSQIRPYNLGHIGRPLQHSEEEKYVHDITNLLYGLIQLLQGIRDHITQQLDVFAPNFRMENLARIRHTLELTYDAGAAITRRRQALCAFDELVNGLNRSVNRLDDALRSHNSYYREECAMNIIRQIRSTIRCFNPYQTS